MNNKADAKIYLSEQRGYYSESDLLKCLKTFNEGTYYDKDKEPVEPLILLNDIVLEAGASTHIEVNKSCHTILIPITGDLQYRGKHLDTKVGAGEIQISSLAAKESFEISNCHTAVPINFLHIQIGQQLQPPFNSVQRCKFDFYTDKNRMILLSPNDKKQDDYSLCMGQFDGRKETIYRLQNANARIFTFVIAGAFEVMGRLLHQGDALALWNTQEIGMEALSNNAIMLLIELL